MSHYLVLGVQQFELVVDERVLGGLLFAQSPLFLQLGAPERLDAVHAGPEFLVGELQLLLEVGQFAVQVGVLVLELTQEVPGVTGVGHKVAAAAAAGRLPGPGRHGAVRVVVDRGERAAVAAVPVERPVVAAVVVAAGVGEYAAAGVAVQRLVPGRRHDAHAVRGTAGAAGPVGRAAGRSHGSAPIVQQHGAVEIVVAAVVRRHAAAAAHAETAAAHADAAHAAAHPGLVRPVVVVGRAGARTHRPSADRAVALSAARARRIRARRRPVHGGQLGGYATGAAGRPGAGGAQRRSGSVRFPGRHVTVWPSRRSHAAIAVERHATRHTRPKARDRRR